MPEIIIVTLTLLLATYYFSIQKHINALEQIYIALICSFIFSCYISIFSDDLHWMKVNKHHHNVFKVVEIIDKTLVALLFISFLAGKAKSTSNFIWSFLGYLSVLNMLDGMTFFLQVVSFKKGWIIWANLLHAATFFFLLYVKKKYRQVLIKEGVVKHESTTPT
ncbi:MULTISPECIES: hypothetical protein [unclassified Bacillus (in: firmicutes)]|uniref:hypothetical protein n=1 Tax=unclassified Bacillus (in: firmicutes) TaxID=185979 RepID=UPI0008F0D483|nr:MULTISPECIES: hypothetical protein [unclassified Bacillus (in: firmicutes)]SFB07523.1 hypothetical protein SAMN02799634_105104 [Bacillus sp. UNCCL13]SFQ87311.1 hypothetical protein SAMN04488577_3016 [Bacillus sp. cl95]